MAGERRILAVSVFFLSLSALTATFQCCGFLLSPLMIQSLRQRQLTAQAMQQYNLAHFGALANVTWTRPRLGELPHLESFTWQNATPADRVTLPGRPGNRLGGLPHLSCKHDQIKMRDYMERRVTPPRWVTSLTWGPPPPCKQALNLCSERPGNKAQSWLCRRKSQLTLRLKELISWKRENSMNNLGFNKIETVERVIYNKCESTVQITLTE